MQGQINPKVVGATVIGFALVAGSFTVKNIITPYQPPVATVVTAKAPERSPISVTDSDNNGIEDWRDEFITARPVIINTTAEAYTPPDTVTGQLGIGLIENIIETRSNGVFAKSNDEVVAGAVTDLTKIVKTKLYDTKDITIIDNYSDEDIKNYANAAALIMYSDSESTRGLDSELAIVYDVVNNGNESRVTELKTIADAYSAYLENTLKLPVPAVLIKEHLDLINTYSAVQADIEAMTLVEKDPVVTLLYLKRYKEDVEGMALALENMYNSLKPFNHLFGKTDPAILFIIFSPDYQVN